VESEQTAQPPALKHSRVLEALEQGLVNMANLCALATIFSNIAYGFGWPVFALGGGTVLLYSKSH